MEEHTFEIAVSATCHPINSQGDGIRKVVVMADSLTEASLIAVQMVGHHGRCAVKSTHTGVRI